MSDKDWKIGGAAGVGGLVLGLLLGPGSGDFTALEKRIDESGAHIQAATTENAANLSGRMDGIDAALAGLGERLNAMEAAAGTQAAEMTDALQSELSNLEAGIAAIQNTMDTRHAAMDARHEAMKAHHAAHPEHGEKEESTQSAGATVLPSDMPETMTMGPGETAIFGADAARVFVSSVAGDGQSARIAVNGLSLVTVQIGEKLSMDACDVMITSISDGKVVIGSNC